MGKFTIAPAVVTRKRPTLWYYDITFHIFQSRRWVGSLSHFWSRRVDVTNRGFSGYNSRWGLSIIDEVVISLRPDMVLIFFGANDAVVPGGSTYVSLSEYEGNIEKMITLIGKVESFSSVQTFFMYRCRTLHYHILH